MNEIQLTKIVTKMFQLELNEDEWDTVFSEMEEIKNLDWLGKKDIYHNKDYNLLNLWCIKKIPTNIMKWFTDKYGKEIWITNKNKDMDINPLSSFLNQMESRVSYRDNVVKNLTYLMNIIPPEKISQEILKKIKNEEENYFRNKDFLGYKVSSWKEPLRTMIWFLKKNEGELAAQWMKHNPEVLNQKQYGHNVASIMGANNSGFIAYINNGGTIFDKVYRTPFDNKENKEGMPLWLWLIQSKQNHNALTRMLRILMEDLEPELYPKEYKNIHVSEELKLKVIQNKNFIKEVLAKDHFESGLTHHNWQEAIKEHSKWRKWRSNDGANFIQWLALNEPANFIRSACKVKKNREMMLLRDNNGNDTLSYFIIGLLVGDLGAKGKSRVKLLSKQYQESYDKIIPYVNHNPKNGILAQLIKSTNTSFFGKLPEIEKKELYNLGKEKNIIEDIFLKYPKVIFNGLNNIDYNSAITSKNKIDHFNNILDLAFSLMTKREENPQDNTKEDLGLLNEFDNLDKTTKLFLMSITLVEMNNVKSGARQYFIQTMDKLIDFYQDKECPLSYDCLNNIIEWRKGARMGFSHSDIYIDYTKKVDMWLSKQILSKEISHNTNKLDKEVDQEKPKRKRKM